MATRLLLHVAALSVCLASGISAAPGSAVHDTAVEPRIVPVEEGWNRTAVNATIFRRNSVTSQGENQYVAFYDDDANVVLAKRNLRTDDWEIRTTELTGDVSNAHNAISIMADGDDVLHLSWNHHGDPLSYRRAVEPGSIELTRAMPMIGQKEERLTYPEFYRLRDGNLLFLYRDGRSGGGNVVLNRYDRETRQWSRLQDTLIHGEGERNAYWQLYTDDDDTIHISWVWRETSDVATNHDLCYAKSTDGGVTWRRSNGDIYDLPITAANAEYAWRIPQNSELINQTSMYADAAGRPYIVTYWRPAGSEVPQYHLVFHDAEKWQAKQIGERTAPFRLSGGGSKRIPISRPQIVGSTSGFQNKLYMIFRDIERGSKVSAAISMEAEFNEWRFQDLTDFSVGSWEPTLDLELWRRSNTLHLFLQYIEQDDDSPDQAKPQTVSVLEWVPPLEE